MLKRVFDVGLKQHGRDVRVVPGRAGGQLSRQAFKKLFPHDIIRHQLVTHAALVSIRQGWDAGVLAGHPVEVGVIRLDPRDNSTTLLAIAPAAGSRGQGFQNMLGLGLSHIADGTNHLLFLLLPTPLNLRAWSP